MLTQQEKRYRSSFSPWKNLCRELFEPADKETLTLIIFEPRLALDPLMSLDSLDYNVSRSVRTEILDFQDPKNVFKSIFLHHQLFLW